MYLSIKDLLTSEYCGKSVADNHRNGKIFDIHSKETKCNSFLGTSLAWVQWVQLHPQIFRKTGFAPIDSRKKDFCTLDFHNIHSKVTLFSVLCSIPENLHPQFLNPNEDPIFCVLFDKQPFLAISMVVCSLCKRLFRRICY